MEKIYRTTKCFGAKGKSKCKGGFPNGLIGWIKKKDWWGRERCHLCSGDVQDKDSVRVDVRPESKPTHLEDATDTSLPNNKFDLVIIDPPYTRQLAKELYGTEKHYHGINAFTKEAVRICKPNGLILTLSYEIPKRLKGCDFIAVCGIYQIPAYSYMRCLTVSRKT